MKKTVKYLILFFIFVFCLTGCVKFNSTMTINKDKSMDYTIIYAFDTSVFGDQSLLTDENKKQLQDKGFKIEDYNENSLKGFTVSKKISNIDYVSDTKNIDYDLSGVLSNKDNTSKIFKVKKGFLKNTYTAKFKFDSSESDLNSSDLNESATESSNEVTEDVTNNITADTQNSESTESLDDLSKMSSSMDLSFNVNLPYSAKSSNATKKENDNKKLTWSLAYGNDPQNIEFSFELYNMNNIFILAGVGGLLLIILVVIIVVLSIGKNKKKPIIDLNTNDNINISNESVDNVVEDQIPNNTQNDMDFFKQPINDIVSNDTEMDNVNNVETTTNDSETENNLVSDSMNDSIDANESSVLDNDTLEQTTSISETTNENNVANDEVIIKNTNSNLANTSMGLNDFVNNMNENTSNIDKNDNNL